ncbi:hypothetical protein P9D57_18020 [Bacillus sonorensis]|uniref:hypothetical protein n=1 Tax=Bacillus sonorensis TaxID=119858 RepID=UPI002DBF10B5|nr:hypothetical protein [Bacillus sonorensis]MEC1440590.1 hypothetical protein [Bacillus sonorensis]
MNKDKFLKRLTKVIVALERDLKNPLILNKPGKKDMILGCLITVKELKKQIDEGHYDKEV